MASLTPPYQFANSELAMGESRAAGQAAEPASVNVALATIDMLRPLVNLAAAGSSSLVSSASRQVWSRGEDAVANVAARLSIRRAAQGFASSSLTVADMDAAVEHALRPRTLRLPADLAATRSALAAAKAGRNRYVWLAERTAQIGVWVGLSALGFTVGAASVSDQGTVRAIMTSVSGLGIVAAMIVGATFIYLQGQVRAHQDAVAELKVRRRVDQACFNEVKELQSALHEVHKVLFHRIESQRSKPFMHHISEDEAAEGFALVQRSEPAEPAKGGPAPASAPSRGEEVRLLREAAGQTLRAAPASHPAEVRDVA